MGKVVLLVGLLVVGWVALVAAETRNAVKHNGFEVIELDYPPYVSEFHYDWYSNKFYAYSNGVFRQINHATNTGFQAVDNITLVPYDQKFIDVRIFTSNQTGQLWAIGPTFNDPNKETSAVGYFNPLTVIGPGVNHDYQGDYRGYTFYSVSVDYRTLSNVKAYFVGWGPGEGASVDFQVVRASLSLTNFQGISWNNQSDQVWLHANTFYPYHTTYKPRIIHDYNTNELFIISPTFLRIYRIGAPDNGPLTQIGSLAINGYGPLTGQSFHWYNDLVYLGFAETTTTPATLLEVNLKTFLVTRKLYFPVNYTNPRAITGRNNTIYVAFEGGPGIIAVDSGKTNLEIIGYARLPNSLQQVYAAWDEGSDWVYYATNEEKSKVFRASKSNFCTVDCPENGFCEKKVCACSSGYTLTSDKKTCYVKVEEEKIISDKGAAIALGILWALTSIAAAAGWYIVYRARQQGYQRVL